MTRVLNPYGDQSGIGEAIANVGKMMFGDTLTPALKREQMRLAGASADKEQDFVNSSRANSALIAKHGTIADVLKNAGGQFLSNAYLAGNTDADKIMSLNLGEQATNSTQYDPISRAMLGAGTAMGSTPAGFGAELSEKKRQFDQTPTPVFDPNRGFVNVPQSEATKFSPVISATNYEGTSRAAQDQKPVPYEGLSEEQKRAMGVNTTTSMSSIGKMQGERDSLLAKRQAMSATDPNLPAMDARIDEYNRAIRQQGKSSSYESTLDKADAEALVSLRKEATTAVDQIQKFDVAARLVDAGAVTGTGAEGRLAFDRLVSLVGGPGAKVANTEALRALLNRNVLDQSGGSLGAQISNSDRDFITATTAQINNSEQGIRLMLEMQKRLASRKIEIAKMAEKYKEQNGSLDTGFIETIRQYNEQNPVFADLAETNNPSPAPQNVGAANVINTPAGNVTFRVKGQ